MHDLDRTLVAVATPPGRGGVGCVRVSGPDAHAIAATLFRSRKSGRSPALPSPPAFGRFVDDAGRTLDHGFLVLFPDRASFTGEPVAELWPHGSPPVLAELVRLAVGAGAEPAGPGEFTYRALRNGRIDLARAEAVRDLVAARTLYQARVAFSQVDGALSRRLAPLREALEEWIARGEAAVEFVDESETHLPPGALRRAVAGVRDDCADLLRGFRSGRIVRDGAALVVSGLPNVGKSSLFNRLLERDRAIVTDVEGTTRDTLEELMNLDGIPVRLVDTAGLRPVDDPVEREGVARAERARAEADLSLLVLDGARDPRPEELAAVGRAVEVGGRAVIVVNKSDLDPGEARALPAPGALRVSALTGSGLDRLRETLRARLVGEGPLEDPILTDARHARAIEAALASLDRAMNASDAGLSEELVLEDLRLAIRVLGEITGEFTTDQLYHRIFSTFCIGK